MALIKAFSYNSDSKQIIVNQTDMIKTKGKAQCWSLNKRNFSSNSKSAAGSLKMKACVDSDARQMFNLVDGKIWVDLELDSGKKYCVTFEGEGKVFVRRCYADLV